MTQAAWDPSFYKTGYEGYERPENFPDREALQNYRSLLLRKTEAQTEFVRRHIGDRRLRVLDIGSGNARLLVSLAQKGLLDFGLGIEIAKSRVEFAQRWIRDLGLTNIETQVGDVLTFDFSSYDRFDLVVCITGAFGYFRPIRDSAPSELLALMRRSVHESGAALLEVYKIPPERLQMLQINHGQLKTWQPLPLEDRFAYYLDDYQYWPDRKIVRHGKTFIARDGSIDTGRFEMLAYYTAAELSTLLRDAGFGNPEIYSDFDDATYDEATSTQMVALTRVTGEQE